MEIFHNDWAEFLNPELKKPYYLELRKFLVDEYKTRQIFPDMYDIFNAHQSLHQARRLCQSCIGPCIYSQQ